MKRYIVFLVLTFLLFNLSAQEISFDEARQKAQEFFFATDKTPQTLKSASVVKVDTFATYYTKTDNQLKSAGQKEEPAFYIFNRTDNPGFVIVSTDERIRDIIAYSNTGVFSDPNPGLKALLNQYVEEIRYAKENNLNANVISHNYNSINNGIVLLKMDVEWGQSPEPYNLKCPFNESTGKNYPTGCVATAIAQIMYYYKYPRLGSGSKKFGDVTVAFDDFEYKYELMQPKNPNPDNLEIAYLLFESAVAVDMVYGPDGGSSGIVNAKNALETYFNYKSCKIESRILNLNNWETLIRNEIDNGRPVYYRAEDPKNIFSDGDNVGHAFIIDGYESDYNTFHLNWGWKGTQNAFYSLIILNPVVNNQQYDFWHKHNMIIGIAPDIADLIPINQSLSTTSIEAGSSVTANCAEENLGSISAGTHVISIHLSQDNVLTPGENGDQYIDEIPVANVDQNSSSNIYSKNITIPLNTPPGTHFLFFSSDGGQVINEIWEDNNFASVEISVTATQEFSVSPDNLKFYDVVTGSSKEKTVKLTNNSETNLLITSIARTGGNADQFLCEPLPPLLMAPGTSINEVITFNPTSMDAKEASIEITTNNENIPVKIVSIKGNGVDHETRFLVCSPSSSYNFGDTKISTSKNKTFAIQNIGSNTCVISSLALEGLNPNEYSITSPTLFPFDLETEKTKQITVRFSPASIGVKNAMLAITNNSDNLSPQHSIELFGNGTENIFSENNNSLVAYEYWFDDQYSNKVTNPVKNIFDYGLETQLPTDELNVGLHRLHLRYKDKKGYWSAIASEFFHKLPISPDSNRVITTFEYWFDNDFAKKFATEITPGQTITTNKGFDVNMLQTGLHSYHVRCKDDAGQWSSVVSEFFHKLPLLPEGERKITACEYWFDDDFANKVSTEITPGQTITTNEGFDTNSLNNGLHSYHVRYKDNAGQWSSVVSEFFHKLPVSAAGERKITAYEYWFDNNYAGKVSVPVSPQQVVSQNNGLDAVSLPPGLHTYHVRYKDDAGQWSSVVSEFFHKLPLSAAQDNLIAAYRYWFNSDEENMQVINLPVPVNPYELIRNINAAGLPIGENTIHFQFKDTRQVWSSVVSNTFYDCTLTVSEKIINVLPQAGTKWIDISTNASWTATLSDNWLDAIPGTESNEGKIKIIFQENLGSARTGTVSVINECGITELITVNQGSGQNAGNTLGNTTVYNSTSVASNRRAIPVTFNEDGTINSLTIYHNGGAGNMLLGVYSNEAGKPAVKLGVTSLAPVNSTEGWQTVALASPVSVSSGQTVWLTWVFQNSVNVRYVAGTPGRAISSQTWSAGMPDDFGASGVSNYNFSVYCNYTPVEVIEKPLGNSVVYSITSTAPNRRAIPVTFNENGQINSISIYHNGGSGSMLMGVYTDVAGKPAARLGVTSSTTVNSAEGWQTVALANPVSVSSGQTVWLSWVFQNSVSVRYVAGTPGRAMSSQTWSVGMPDDFGTSGVSSYNFSVYCNYTPVEIIEKPLGNSVVYNLPSTTPNRRAIPVTFNENGQINSISIYHNGGAGSILLAVYDDVAGKPAARLGVTSSTTVNSAEGWQTVTLANPVSVSSGQTVWLSWVFQNSVSVRYVAGTPGRAMSSQTWSEGMPDDFGTSGVSSYNFSVYCNYTPASAGLLKDGQFDKMATESIDHQPIEANELKVYPNPFSQKLNFEFVSAQDAYAILEIYNLNGQLITKLLDQQVQGGVMNRIEYAPNEITSGMYVYRLNLNGKTTVGKVIYKK